MIINGKNYPSIGHMRAKPVGDEGGYILTIYPPGPGPLAGAEPATMVEIDVNEAEYRRICRAARHLLTRTLNRHEIEQHF